MTTEQKTPLLDNLVTFCLEDNNFLENRLLDLIDLKGEDLELDALVSSCLEDTSFLEKCLAELISHKGEELQDQYGN